jgi:16S rRNA processing protein RimM
MCWALRQRASVSASTSILTPNMSARPSPDEMLLIGYVTHAHGVRGQIKLHALTDRPEHLSTVKTVYLGDDLRSYSLRRAAEHKASVLIVTLGGVDTREAAEALRGQEVFIRERDAQPLAEDEYYLHDLPGLRVENVVGEELGTVKDVVETGANEVLVVVRSDGSELLVPMIRDVVKRLDIIAKLVVIEPLPGMLD